MIMYLLGADDECGAVVEGHPDLLHRRVEARREAL
jgi:hypothetical protein